MNSHVTDEELRGEALRRLQALPGIGPSLADDLLLLGYHSPVELVGQDAVEMFERLQRITGTRQDPCVLDVFQCAVYVAGSEEPDPELAKWWIWSRRRKAGRAPQVPGREVARDAG